MNARALIEAEIDGDLPVERIEKIKGAARDHAAYGWARSHGFHSDTRGWTDQEREIYDDEYYRALGKPRPPRRDPRDHLSDYWVNQPSTLQPGHRYHGQNVRAPYGRDKETTVQLADGSSVVLPRMALVAGHRK